MASCLELIEAGQIRVDTGGHDVFDCLDISVEVEIRDVSALL